MLLVLEGCDGTGKSTLAKALATQIQSSAIIHHGPYTGYDSHGLAGTFAASMKLALTGNNLIMDRSWLSEPVYATWFREEPSRIDKVQQAMLERIALRCGAVVIRCMRPFFDVKKTFTERKNEEYLANEEQLHSVWTDYLHLPEQTALPVITYDYEQTSVEDLVTFARDRLAQEVARKKVYLVGEKANVRTPAQAAYSVPFVSFTGNGCSKWLTEQLIDANISERNLSWLNACEPNGVPYNLKWLATSNAKGIIALGRVASLRLAEQGISHTVVPHPQAHKRFHFDKPYQLIQEIERALR